TTTRRFLDRHGSRAVQSTATHASQLSPRRTDLQIGATTSDVSLAQSARSQHCSPSRRSETPECGEFWHIAALPLAGVVLAEVRRSGSLLRAVAAAEVFAGEADGDRAFADSGRDSFDGAAAYVADREYAGEAALEQVRIAAELVPLGCVARL